MASFKASALLLVVSACAGAATPEVFEPMEAPVAPAGATAGAATPVRVARAWTHGVMNLRAGPGTTFAITVEIPAGTELRIGMPNSGGWAEVYDVTEFSMDAAVSRGWIYTRSTRLKASPPPAPRGRG